MLEAVLQKLSNLAASHVQLVVATCNQNMGESSVGNTFKLNGNPLFEGHGGDSS